MNFEPIDLFQRQKEFRRRSNEKLDELLAELQSSEQIKEPISFQPEVDLVETDCEFRFYLSIPGLVEDDIIIKLDGAHLTIRGVNNYPLKFDTVFHHRQLQQLQETWKNQNSTTQF